MLSEVARTVNETCTQLFSQSDNLNKLQSNYFKKKSSQFKLPNCMMICTVEWL